MEFEDYKKYKWFFTKSGKLVVGGKSALQNDFLLKKITSQKENYFVMHTSSPGSPFSVIISDIGKVKKDDLEECAVFTGCFSKAWKEGKYDTFIDIFMSKSLFKIKSMNEGTWGVKEKLDRLKVKLEMGLVKQDGILRAVPLNSIKDKSLGTISPGKKDKDKFAEELTKIIKVKKDDILSAIPTGGISFKK